MLLLLSEQACGRPGAAGTTLVTPVLECDLRNYHTDLPKKDVKQP